MSGDARGYSWPPAEPGNRLAERHGAWSPRRVDPIASELVAMVDADDTVTWLRSCDRPLLHSWARAEARISLLMEWLADHGGDVADDGEVRPAAMLLDRIERTAAGLADRLGFSPAARARLGRDTAAGGLDLARLMARGDGGASGACRTGSKPENGQEGPVGGDQGAG